MLAKLGDRKIDRAFWLMTDQLFKQFIEDHSKDSQNPIYFINLADIHPMRTRSCNIYILTLLNNRTRKLNSFGYFQG